MKSSVFFLITVVSISFIYLSQPGDAYAYLDPGTGSYIFQILIAVFLGGLFAIKLFWGRIKNFCLRLMGKKVDEDTDNETSSEY